MAAVKTLKQFGRNSGAPAVDEHRAAVKEYLDVGVGKSLGEHQNRPGAVDIRGRQTAATGASSQLLALGFGEEGGLGTSEHVSITTLIK
jgi:hypothetical protein